MPKFSTALLHLEWIISRLPLTVLGLTLVTVAMAVVSFGLQIKQNWLLKLPSDVGDFETAPLDFTAKNIFSSNPTCLFLTLRNSQVVCLSPKTGKLRWQTWLAEPSSEPPKIVSDDTTILFSTTHGGFQAVNTFTGRTIWQFQNPGGYHWEFWDLSKNQQDVIALDRHNTLFVIEVATGTVRWSKTVPITAANDLNSDTGMTLFFKQVSIWQADDATIYWANFETGEVVALAEADGALQWQHQDFTNFLNSDFSVFHKRIWYRTKFNELVSAYPDNGEQLTSSPLYPNDLFTFTPNYALIHNLDTTIKWYDLIKGKLVRTTQLPSKIKKLWFEHGTLLAQLATAPFQETIVAINEKTGEIFWQTPSLGVIRQVLFLSDQSLAVIGAEGKIWWLNAKDGTVTHEATLTGEPSFMVANPNNPNQLWVLSRHRGSVGTAALTDVSFFGQPGTLTTQWSDLLIDPTTAFLNQNRLWVVGQDHSQLVSLLNQPLWPTWFKLRQPTTVPSLTKPVMAEPRPRVATVDATVSQLNRTCLATWTATIPHSGTFTQLLDPKFNPWTDVQLKITVSPETPLASASGTLPVIHGYYAHDRIWQAVAALPATGKWLWRSTLTGPGWQQTASGSFTTSADCGWDFLQVNARHQLVTPDQQPFWAVGLQDSIFDSNDNGTIFDQWVAGQTIQPPAKNQPVTTTPLTTYLDTYAQAGFGLYRLSLDNFSFSLWHSLDQTGFHGSPLAGQWVETFLQELRRRNYRVMFTVFGFKPVTDKAAVQPYLDYVINHFGPYVDIWELSNEAWLDADWVNSTAEYIKTHDPYHHPVTVSWERGNLANIDLNSLHYYRSEPWAELDNEFLAQIMAGQRWQKPTIFSELGNSNQSWDIDSADRLRVKTWLSAWYHVPMIVWNQSRFALTNTDNANLYLGPTERQVVTINRDWLKQHASADFNLVSAPQSAPGCYGQTNAKDTLLLYCFNRSHTSQTVITPIVDWLAAAQLPAFDAKKWQVSWFDPATGKLLTTTRVTQSQPVSPAFTTDIVSEWKIIN